ncbi:DNA ligase [Luteimonas salinisoli]|uniref:DNA ligase n=1 Tax=Luteimonas salinisoli TaxID=2752307 RepID=UPI0031F30E49
MRLPLFALLVLLVLAPMSAAQAAGPPRLMLATRYTPGVEVADYWVSEKLDGVRGRWDGRALWTRGGYRVRAPDWFTAGWPAEPMDGELWMGRGRFEEVSALVRAGSADADAWRDVRFMVFDLPAAGGPFTGRVARMRALLEGSGIAWLQAVPQQRPADAAALEARLRAVVAAGGEGLMLHHGEARYRVGRSDRLLKLKPFEDAEARVVEHLPGRGKYAGMTGSLLVERADGARFRIGSGMSDAQRATPPPVGSRVTYRYSGLTVNGLPRFARLLRVREESPPPDPE